jgi:uncharacterized protein with von Willebrand factor type A (vWA) domain
MRIVALCDVSGSMTVYARVFLAFLKGLVAADTKTDAYLFHTRLMRVTDALKDNDSLRAAARLYLMAKGFGGRTDIAGSLRSFLDGYGARALDGRTVVIVLSDGYCSSDPKALSAALRGIRRQGTPHRVAEPAQRVEEIRARPRRPRSCPTASRRPSARERGRRADRARNRIRAAQTEGTQWPVSISSTLSSA